jgi:dTDP-4-dehydrorhamnose reductase
MASTFERVLITGGEGMLGTSFHRMAQQTLGDSEVLSLGKHDLDITDFDAVRRIQLDFKPDLILHCAALVNAELCESEPAQAKEVIFVGTKNLIDTSDQQKVKFVYPQSFLVYDCTKLPIDEDTKPNPSFVYAREKYNAERYVTDHFGNHLVVVMAGFFGGFEKDKNFVGSIIPVILNRIRESIRTIEIGDRVWQPTYTDDLAANTLLLASRGQYKRYCLGSFGESSFAELASEIVRVLGLSAAIEISTVSSLTVAQSEKAKRPQRAVVSNARAINEKLCTMREWKTSLGEYLRSQYFTDLVKTQWE